MPASASLCKTTCYCETVSNEAARIEFALKGEGPFVLEIMTPLPAINDAVTIDGYSQSGAMVN